jgi:hypothetical protein
MKIKKEFKNSDLKFLNKFKIIFTIIKNPLPISIIITPMSPPFTIPQISKIKA